MSLHNQSNNEIKYYSRKQLQKALLHLSFPSCATFSHKHHFMLIARNMDHFSVHLVLQAVHHHFAIA